MFAVKDIAVLVCPELSGCSVRRSGWVLGFRCLYISLSIHLSPPALVHLFAQDEDASAFSTASWMPATKSTATTFGPNTFLIEHILNPFKENPQWRRRVMAPRPFAPGLPVEFFFHVSHCQISILAVDLD